MTVILVFASELGGGFRGGCGVVPLYSLFDNLDNIESFGEQLSVF